MSSSAARPSTRASLVATLAGLVLLYLLVRFLFPFVVALVVGGVLYYLFAPLVAALERRRVPRFAGTLVVLLLVLGLAALAALALVPRLYAELTALARDLPEHVERLEQWLGGTPLAGDDVEASPQEAVNALLERADAVGTGAVNVALNTLSGAVESLAALLFGIVIGFYLLLGGPAVAESMPRWIPPGQRGRWARFGRRASDVLSGYLRARLIASLFIGTTYGVSFWLIGLPEPLLLGVLGGVLNLVPTVGPIIAAIPAVIVAAVQSWTLVLVVLAVMVVAQQIESYLIDPHLEGHYTRLPPTVVVLAVAAGSALAGVAGLLLAVPIVALARVALEVFYRESWEESEPRPDEPAPAGDGRA